LLVGAFLPDLLWIALARLGAEPAQPTNFFDDWSHSLLSVVVLASLFAMVFWRSDKAVVFGIWLAVFSHFMLDFPVHPSRLALYPLSRIHLGWDLLAWGSRPGWFGAINDWWLQFFVLLILLYVYVKNARTWEMPANLSLASCTLLLGLQLLMLFACIGY
jgi:hypothetical protein